VKHWQFVPTHFPSGSSRRDWVEDEDTVKKDKTYLNETATIIMDLPELFDDDTGAKCKP
jgi:hypothetical protein